MKDVRDPRASKMRDHKRRHPKFESSYHYEGIDMKRRADERVVRNEIRANVGKIGG